VNRIIADAIAGARNVTTLRQAIEALFSHYGAVERIHLLPDHQDGPRSVGCMVDMATSAEAMAAQNQLGVTVFGFKTLIFSLQLPDEFDDRINL
jgi:hypothetical protein